MNDSRQPFARSTTLAVCAALLLLPLTPGCGGTDQQPVMPSPSAVDPHIDDLELPEEGGGGEDEEVAEDEEPPPPPVQVVAGERTPIEGAAPTVRFGAPRNDQLIRRGAVTVRLDVGHWDLQPDPGQHVHLILDNEPYIAIRDVSQPLDLNALVQQNLGHELTEGTHVLRAFPSRGHHESAKNEGAFAVLVFHYGSRTAGFRFDPNAPLLTYSRPKGCNPANSRVMIDFYLSHASLAADGTRVRYSIDQEVEGDITSWAPHFIENLPEGEHSIRLSLVGADGELVAGPFNDTTRTIQVGGCQ